MKRMFSGFAPGRQRRPDASHCGLGWASGLLLSAEVLLFLTLSLALSGCFGGKVSPQPIAVASVAPVARVEVVACPDPGLSRPTFAYPSLGPSADWEDRTRTALADLAAWVSYALRIEPAARCGVTGMVKQR